MVWWVICFAAVVVTLGAKFYFTTAIERLRRTLSRQQRETLELKGALADTRQDHQQANRLIREKAASTKRLKSQIAQMQGQIKSLKEKD